MSGAEHLGQKRAGLADPTTRVKARELNKPPTDSKSNSGFCYSANGSLNMADVAGMSRQRDTRYVD